jgi:predicted aldo/keto reductase-like oxidoreductase
MGGDLNFLHNQIQLRKAVEWDVNFWDTAYIYGKGNAETGMGVLLKEDPEARKKLFLATKASGAKNVKDLDEFLQTSLKRLNTTYIDLYCGIHGLSNPDHLTDDVKKWATEAKKSGLIKFFGFSTHSNVEKCLLAAAKLDWIDAVMFPYSYRVIDKKDLNEAIEACHKAGVGLVAMKTQARASAKEENTPEQAKLIEHFKQRGFDDGQAKIKIVLEDPRIASACVAIGTVSLLKHNVEAVTDKKELITADREILRQYAAATCSGFCTGCEEICANAVPEAPYVRDIMRYLMYHDSYGRKRLARDYFAQIPANVRERLLTVDYTAAEAGCPQRIPIAKMMTQAIHKLA